MLKRNALLGALLGSVLALPASAATITALTVATGEVIATPGSVTNDLPDNAPVIQGFNEKSNVLLAVDLVLQNYTAANTVAMAGTRVDSHMFFMNQESGAPDPVVETSAQFSFSSTVLGIITSDGALDATDTLLGALGTTYEAGFTARGLEGGDSVSFAGNTVTLNFRLTQPGDWVRVITEADLAPVPLPAGAPLMLVGLGAFALMRRKAKKV